MKEVIVYSKNMCGYCVQAKNWLKNKGIEYKGEWTRVTRYNVVKRLPVAMLNELVKLNESAFK